MTSEFPANAQENSKGSSSSGGLGRFFVIVFCLVIVMALFSFKPEDIDFFAGGISSAGQFPKNLLGKCGAYLAWSLILTFGFSAHATAILIFASALRRLVYPRYIQPVSILYFFALILFTLSLSILLGTQPNFLPVLSASANLSGIPGGVIGQRLGDPCSGWLHLSLNTTGSILCSAVGLCTSLYVLYLFDGALLVRMMLEKHKQRSANDDATGIEPDESPIRHADIPGQRASAASRQPAKAQRELPIVQPSTPATAHAPAPTIRTIQPKELPVPPKNVKPENYQLPPTSLLNVVETDSQSAASAKEIQLNEDLLQQCLDSFNVDAKVLSSVPGPQVTLIKLSTAPGLKVEKISRLERNIMLTLKATSLRILAPIPGENLVGVEVPNKILTPVSVRSLLEDPLWKSNKGTLPILLGKNVAGKTIIIDLAKAPHLLIAGATGAGKSVCMNVIILSLLYKYSPSELKLIMVDPKRVEFSAYQKLPHLLTPVIMDTEKVSLALKWAVREMERRLSILQVAGVRDLIAFNARKVPSNPQEELLDKNGDPIPEKMPFIVIIIDELADIMATSKKDVETSLARLAAVARATGIHVIIATQRPDVKVLTGTIKNNFPVRIAFRVSAMMDSMTILDGKGAESLLGKGDMLYKSGGIGFERIQGAMAEDEERNHVVDFISQQLPQHFEEDIFAEMETPELGLEDMDEDGDMGDEDSLYRKAVHVVIAEKKTSISYVQRRLGIGYNKAANFIERMEEDGIVGPPDPSNKNARELLVTSEEHR